MFNTYLVTFRIMGRTENFQDRCMTVKGETTTQDFPKMLAIKHLGDVHKANRITVLSQSNLEAQARILARHAERTITVTER